VPWPSIDDVVGVGRPGVVVVVVRGVDRDDVGVRDVKSVLSLFGFCDEVIRPVTKVILRPVLNLGGEKYREVEDRVNPLYIRGVVVEPVS